MILSVRTERLSGERICESHREELMIMHRDPKVMATLGGVRSDEESERFFQDSLDHWTRYGFGLWVFHDPENGRYAGRAGIRHVDVGGAHEIELAYALMADYWGRGMATEIGRELLKIAFGPLGLEEIVCFTLTSNIASQSVMKKLGFQFEKEINHAGLPHVLFRTHVSILNADSRKS